MKRIFSILTLFFCAIIGVAQSAFFNLAKSYAEKGDYKEAIRLTKLSIDTDKSNPDKLDLLFDYCQICEYYSYIQEPDSCIFYGDLSLSLWPDLSSTGIEYDAILSNLSHSYSRVKLYDLAKQYRQTILDDYIEKYGPASPQIVNQYRLISDFAKTAGECERAIEYAKKEETLNFSIRDIQSDFDQRIPYSESLSFLRYIIEECSDVKEGIYYLLDIVDKHNEAISDDDYTHTLNTIWSMCRDNDFPEGCIAVYKEEALHGNYKQQFEGITNLYAEDKSIANDINAPSYGTRLYELISRGDEKKEFSEEEIPMLYYILCNYFSTVGDIPKYFELACLNYEWRKSHEMDLMYHDLCLLGAASNLPDQTEYSICHANEILESGRYADDTEMLNMVYEYLGAAYFKKGEQEKALECMAKVSGDDEFDALYSQSSILMQGRDLKSLLPVALKLNEYPNLGRVTKSIIFLELMISARDSRRSDILLNISRDYVEAYRNAIIENIPLMDEKEQEKFLTHYPLSNTLSYDFLLGFNGYEVEWADPDAAYDYTLLKKGILLTSQNNFRNTLASSKDDDVRDKWKRYMELEAAGDNSNILEHEILRRDLIQYASSMDTYLEKYYYKWEDVQNALKPGEAAVEYIVCYNFDDFSDKECDPLYIALLITKDCERPLVIPLTYTGIVQEAIQEDYLADDNYLCYVALWAPLENHIENVHTLYFSPAERLNSVAMEYMPYPQGRACDKWNLIRLSSTKELIEREKHAMNGDGDYILFGGLDYDLNPIDIAQKHNVPFTQNYFATRGSIPENVRYGFDNLENTIIEVQDISKILKEHEKPCFLYEGEFGTEESFRNLSDKNVSVIHLATHGFFWNREMAETHNYIDFLKGIDASKPESVAMDLTGLLFSGANMTLRGDPLPPYIEDGVLRASELANMNFGNVDMVVLSACQSGLGETNGEGVFGLQRGFKLAGAKSLLMSLWDVDDEATKILMVEFYKHLLSGKSKSESLSLAQDHVKNTAGYENPKYWAAWILLDALN